MYAANIRLYDPAMIDVSVSTSKPAKGGEGGGAGAGSGRAGGRKTGEDASLSRLLSSMGPGTSALFDYTQYPKFVSLLSGRDSVRPKSRPLPWLMRLIEEIYDSRYAKDTADLQGEDSAKASASSSAGGESSLFPVFVWEYFSKRYGLRGLIDQMCWDLLYNTHTLRKVRYRPLQTAVSLLSIALCYKLPSIAVFTHCGSMCAVCLFCCFFRLQEHLEVEVFARFLEEYYDPDDLLFFLYVRSVTQKELNINFRARWSEGRTGAGAGAGGSPRTVRDGAGGAAADGSSSTAGGGSNMPAPVYLTFRECAVVSRVAFGNEADPLYKTFMAMIERNMTATASASASSSGAVGGGKAGAGGKGDKRRIDVTQFLHLALVEYHETRPAEEGSGADAGAGGSGSALGASGVSASSPLTAADRLFQSAARSYDLRASATGTATAGAGDLTLQDIDHTGGGAGGAGAGGKPAASAALLEAVGEVMHTANQAYLDRLLTSSAGLPAEVADQIRTELQAQLESKVDSMLAAAITAAQTGTASGSIETDKLAAKFNALVASGSTGAGALRPFCDAVLATDEVKRIVEPLVTLLVTYAKGKLSGQ